MSKAGNGNGGNGIGDYKKPVICIECGKRWEADSPNSFNCTTPTGGICDLCLKKTTTPVIRRRQLKEGNFDCFGKAKSGFCDQSQCKYAEPCLRLSSLSSVNRT
ncbi:hypothetical protein L6249_02630 [Candidatus Parcubacteria bacterium]|nr:hypothetical protein [Patescibacteria group bacterium]MCG2690939.1 hypothetical protein [Candidatus Parcubacteria bacterium]